MAKKVAQMIEEQLQFWRISHPEAREGKRRSEKQPVITISREFGAKGAALANELGKKLSFKVWDKEILDVISKKLGSSSEYLQALDENSRNLLEDTIFGFMNHKGTNLNYQIYLVKAIRSIEDHGSSIIIGRAANFICRNPRSLHVRVVCPMEERIKQYAASNKISLKQARAVIQQKDLERENFTLFNFNRDVEQASHYDLILNSARFSMDEMVELVEQAYALKKKAKEPIVI
ncbi:MAG: AAA family ATPase [Balneola sp.]